MKAVFTLTASAILLTVACDASASCNAAPSAGSLYKRSLNLEFSPKTTTGVVWDEGAAGRINTIFFVPLEESMSPFSFHVESRAQQVFDPDDRVILVFDPVGGDVWDSGRFFFYENDPDAQEPCSAVSSIPDDMGFATFGRACGAQPVIEGTNGNLLKLNYPTAETLRVSKGAGVSIVRSGNLKIVVMDSEPDEDDLRELTNPCKAPSDDDFDPRVKVCIDTLNIPKTLDTSPVGCSLVAMPKLNDFTKLCDSGTGLMNGLAPCKSESSNREMLLQVDACGAMHVGFAWGVIANPPAGWTGALTGFKRRIEGKSGFAVTDNPSRGKIRMPIPGREFLASTTERGAGEPFEPDVEVLSSHGDQFLHITGTVEQDKPSSVVHIYPRMLVTRTCGSGSQLRACDGIERVDSKYEGTCACDNVIVDSSNGTKSYDYRCVNSTDCNESATPAFFSCIAGDYEGMPCTRRSHCAPTAGDPGECRPAKCRAGGEVWRKGQSYDFSDANCPSPTGCSGGRQCGLRLFDVTANLSGGGLLMDRTMNPRGHRKRRGYCSGDPARECIEVPVTDSPDKRCGGSAGTCRGFGLIAGDCASGCD